MGPTDPALISALSQAQAAGARIVSGTAARLERGMSIEDIRALAGRLAQEEGTPLLEPARVSIGPRGASFPLALARAPRLEESTLVTIDVRPQVGRVAGDYARTVRYGENGRLWFYDRIAQQVFDTFVSQLGGCRHERDALDLAADCAFRQGCRLIAPRKTIGHHLPVPMPAIPMRYVAFAREQLEHRVRAAVPFGLATPPLRGIWALEPCFEVDERRYLFEDVFEFTEDGARRLGEPAVAEAR